MKHTILLIALLVACLSFGQDAPLSMFDNLVNKTWKAEGSWGDGTKFVQEIEIKYALNKTAVIAESVGFIDKQQTKLGPRNHGIRQFDPKTKTVRFWEFDAFGGLTEGTVFAKGKNIIYQYQYGTSTVTDMWEYVDDNTYNFKVGDYQDGTWKQVYLSTQFKSQP